MSTVETGSVDERQEQARDVTDERSHPGLTSLAGTTQAGASTFA
jgi:hypothetical protein